MQLKGGGSHLCHNTCGSVQLSLHAERSFCLHQPGRPFSCLPVWRALSAGLFSCENIYGTVSRQVFFFFFFKLNKSTCVCAHLMLLIRVPAGADFLWSDLKTFPRIRARPRRSRAELTGPHHIWHSVTRVACHDVVQKKKKEKRIQEERRRAASSCFISEQEQPESKEKVGGRRAGNLSRQGFEMFALEQENNTIITMIWSVLCWGHSYCLSPSFCNINQQAVCFEVIRHCCFLCVRRLKILL